VRAVLGQLVDALDCFPASFAHDVSCAELLPQRDPPWVAAEQDDSLGAETLRRDHSAQADGAVAHHGDGLARLDLGRESGMMAGAHHVGEREQGGHERVVLAHREHDQGAVRLRNAHRLALAAFDVGEAVPAAVQTLALQPFPAEDAAAVRSQERREDQIAGSHARDVRPDRVDDADELVPHSPAGIVRAASTCTARDRCRRSLRASPERARPSARSNARPGDPRSGRQRLRT
jgi:hypothetical protein